MQDNDFIKNQPIKMSIGSFYYYCYFTEYLTDTKTYLAYRNLWDDVGEATACQNILCSSVSDIELFLFF